MSARTKHVGKWASRMEHDCHQSRMERAFADAWEEANNPKGYVNRGIGTLDWLLHWKLSKNGLGGDEQIVTQRSTSEEIEVAATVIQWLGTHVGFCWLEQTLLKAGYRLVREERRKP